MKGYQVKDKEHFKVSKVMEEFVNAMDTLHGVKNAVGVFGSARIKPHEPYYESAVRLGMLLAKAGFATATGGGPGIMEAANKGAYKADGVSIGLNIDLPHEQCSNEFTNVSVDFNYFFVRKVMIVKTSTAIVVYPGGFGTLDELFEVLTLLQTRKCKNLGFKLVLVGTDFWQGLIDWLKGPVLESGLISAEDFTLFKIMDDPREIVDYIKGR